MTSRACEKIADRPGDLRGRERGSRDLVQKRLKQVMIAAIDHGDADRRPGKGANGLEPAVSGADHDHMMTVQGRVHVPLFRALPAPALTIRHSSSLANGRLALRSPMRRIGPD